VTVYSRYSNNRKKKNRTFRYLTLRKLGISFLTFTTTLVVLLQVATWLNAQEMFLLKKIKIEGNRFLDESDVLKFVKVDSSKNLFDFDLALISKQVEQHPLIKAASVSRGLPSRLIVHVTEKEPLALLSGPELMPIDANGEPLDAFKPDMLFDYPVITNLARSDAAQGGQSELKRVIDFLNYTKVNHFALYSQISEISYTSDFGIYFYLCEGTVPVVAGNEQPEQKCAKLLKTLPKIEAEDAFSNIQYFDLRFENRVIVKTT